MAQNYPEQATERARQLEQAARQQGYSMAGHPASAQGAPAARPRTNNAIALGLIGFCTLLLVNSLLPDSDSVIVGLVLLTIASSLFFFGFWKRIYPLVIPASLLAGLGLGVPYADLTHGASIPWGLALGFGAILLIGQRLFGRTHVWPAIPGVILLTIGTIIGITTLPTFLIGGLAWIPLALMGAGLYLGWQPRTR